MVDVVWRRFGLHVFLTYAAGDRELLTGDLVFAQDVAQGAGLRIVESSAATAHWVKDPEAWHGATAGHMPKAASSRPMHTPRKVISIVWYSYRPDWYELDYVDGHSERIPGTQVDAAALARAGGMKLVPTRDGTVRWK